MDNSPLVSVIVPVFNKQKHLEKCLRSLLTQTYSNIEIIVVNDNSCDNSCEIAHQILKGVHRSFIINNNANLGKLKSRYIGINNAHGLYTAFLDADYWMENKTIAHMVDMLRSLDVDMVQVRHQRRMRGIAVKINKRFDPLLVDTRIDSEEFRSLASYIGLDSIIHPACCGKLYITSKLREAAKVEFNYCLGEDQIFNIQYLRECKSMAFSDFVGYNYRWGGETPAFYKFSSLKAYKHVYHFKRMLGQDENSINNEICMLLRLHIRSLFTELGYTREAVEMVISDELRDPLWRSVGITSDAASIIDDEYSGVQRNTVKYFLKRLLH